eukprot:TRINITY_DN14756_c0_g1_i1.p1 TRINITY_DN14756_c0_g1~~TRINITY_DN14756_c0_g1_i1.p1  ORF type:complete len:688 (-),score=133.77 TRINITY_DN14756_c0_g1_i1:857-2920(-)
MVAAAMTMWRVAALPYVLTLGILMQSVHGAPFIVETNSLRVKASGQVYDTAMAAFGVPNYGGSLTGQLVYVSSNAQACTPFAESLTKGVTPGQVPVALIERGGCTFVTKTVNAQAAGAQAVLVVDNTFEALATMAVTDDRDVRSWTQGESVTVPVAMMAMKDGRALIDQLAKGEQIVVEMDWREAIPHPDNRVEWEYWGTSSGECGAMCGKQAAFKVDFAGIAKELERGGYTLFTPHFLMWPCPSAPGAQTCTDSCIANGRYCASDPDGDSSAGYSGADVARENLRQLCLFQSLTAAGTSWDWWTYVTSFDAQCSFRNNRFTPECAYDIMTGLGADVAAVKECESGADLDQPHPLLEAELSSKMDQEGSGRGQVVFLPTVVVNTNQYRGRLNPTSVLEAICSGFAVGSEPSVCLSGAVETNECLDNNGGCWAGQNVTACIDTFRGWKCACPTGYLGDGYKCHDLDECTDVDAACPADEVCVNSPGSFRCDCKPGYERSNDGTCVEPSGCKKDNGGCAQGCVDAPGSHFCTCAKGYTLAEDGKTCTDVDECATNGAQCEHRCVNTLGSYFCVCHDNYVLYPGDGASCIRMTTDAPRGGDQRLASALGVSFLFMVLAAAAGFGLYKYRMRAAMQEEIRAIITEYMPLDDDPEIALGDKSAASTSAKATVAASNGAESSTSALLEARDAP